MAATKLRRRSTLSPTLAAPPFFAVPSLQDNYTWVVVGHGQRAIVIDPGEASPVVAALARHDLTLAAILATHHHHDHVGGISALVAQAGGDLQVWGSGYDVGRGRIPHANRTTCDGVPFTAAGVSFTPLDVPGHTLGAVAFWCPEQALLFSGDTLFLGGCGRLFEGSAATMWHSLRRLRQLPPQTRVCCGHDYVHKNLRFAATVLPVTDVSVGDCPADEQLKRDAGGDVASPPLPPPWATLATECRRNPFLRADAEVLGALTGQADEAEVFAELRRRRDVFC